MAEAVQNPIDDVRNDVAAALAQLKGDAAEPEVTDDPPEIEAEAAETPAAEPAADRARAPDGKFIAKDTAVEAPVEAAPAKEIASTDAAKASDAPAPTPAIAPPAGWTPAEKAEWSKLSPVAQAAVSRREAEISRGGQQWSEEKRRYEGLIAPVSQAAQRRGMSAEQGLNALMAAQDRLDRNPAEAISWLAQSYGVDLAALASNPPAPQARAVDPAVPQFFEKVSTLESRLNDFLQNQTLGVVESFSKSPDHPHYADVEGDLLRIIPMVQQNEPGLSPMDVLQRAYDQAIWLNPDVRAKMLEEQKSASEASRLTTLKTKQTQATKAAVSIKGSSNGAPSPKKESNSSGDVYEDVRAAIHQLRA